MIKEWRLGGLVEIMKMMYWEFAKWGRVKAKFDKFPNSTVIFRLIKSYYFVYTVDWSEMDHVLTRMDLEKAELLINRELGLEKEFLKRKGAETR